MRIFSGQLVVALTLFLTNCASSELQNVVPGDGVTITREANLTMQIEELTKSLEESKSHFIKELANRTAVFEDVVEKLNKKLQETQQELLANIETKFAKELNAIREEASRRMKLESKVIVENTSSVIKHFSENVIQSAASVRSSSRDAIESLKRELKETKKDFNATSQILLNKIKVTEETLAENKQELLNTKIELENTRANLSKTIDDLSTKLNSTRTELGETESIARYSTSEIDDETSYLVDFSQMPTSCIDLKRMGQQISGIFLVKGSKNLETVYCSFHPKTGNETQQWIGYADVKSVPVHFYAQKNSTFDTTRTPIPFDSALVNEGNAMNLTSGIFTAPRSGTYFFSFTGAAVFPTSSSSVWLGVVLYLNGVKSGMGHVEEANTVDNQSSPLNLQSTLNLKSGDEVWVQIDYRAHEASLFGNADYGTHFTGFMLEEEIIASL